MKVQYYLIIPFYYPFITLNITKFRNGIKDLERKTPKVIRNRRGREIGLLGNRNVKELLLPWRFSSISS